MDKLHMYIYMYNIINMNPERVFKRAFLSQVEYMLLGFTVKTQRLIFLVKSDNRTLP